MININHAKFNFNDFHYQIKIVVIMDHYPKIITGKIKLILYSKEHF